MSFKLEHWENPRKTIATVYEDNDMAYVTHGIKCAYIVIDLIDEKPSLLKDRSILEYGCGTGKNLRAIHYYFKHAVGYDPVSQCIVEANKEKTYINAPHPSFPTNEALLKANMLFTTNLADIHLQKWDYIYCQDVIQHLNVEDALFAINNILDLLAEGGKAYINLPATRASLFDSFNIKKSTSEKFGHYIILEK